VQPVSRTLSLARRDCLVLGPTLNRSESRCWACLEIGPWSPDVVAYVVAVLLRRESGSDPLAGIDPKTRALDILVIDDPLAVAGRDVVAARVVRNFDDFPEELVRLLLARAAAAWARGRAVEWLLMAKRQVRSRAVEWLVWNG
jgi:hypothetical protein